MSESPSKTPVRDSALREIRYSLQEMLRETELERDGSSIGQEIVDQSEINKLFQVNQKENRERPGE